MSEYRVIKNEDLLAQTFRARITSGEFPWVGKCGAEATLDSSTGGLNLKLDSLIEKFTLEWRLNPGRRDVEQLALRKDGAPILLVTVRLSQALVRHCRQLGVSCADLNGRAWIRTEGMMIDTTFAPPMIGGVEYRSEEKDPDLFSPKSSRLARVLLTFRDRGWKQSDIVDLTGLAAGLVSRLLNHLVKIGWVERARGGWRLRDFDALLDAWAQADNWAKRVTLRQYSTLERDLPALARRLTELPGHTIACTQWFAAGLRFPYADVPVLSVYRDALPDPDELAELGFTEVNTGGRVWIVLPRDTGVFQAGRHVDGLPLVSDAQIYLDLLQVGLRGPDQAKALREWTGFCR